MNNQADPRQLVEQIGRILLPTGITAIRTDYKVMAGGASRRYLVLESAVDKPRYAVLSPRPNIRPIGIERLVKYTGLSDQDADQVLDLAHALSEGNDIGSWPLGLPADVESRVVDGDGVGDLSYAAFPALAKSYDLLNDLLDGRVSRIEIDVRKLPTGRGTRRHAWHFYYDCDGRQISALHSQNTGAILTQWMFPRDHSTQDPMERYVRGWGGQLQVAPDVMAAVFLEVIKLEQFMAVTTVDLA